MVVNPPNAPIEAPPEPSSGRMRNLSALSRQAAYTPTYTRLVRRLRIVLPVVGVLTIVIVILWPRIRAEFNHPTETTKEDRQARMVNGRYVGSDSHGRPLYRDL